MVPPEGAPVPNRIPSTVFPFRAPRTARRVTVSTRNHPFASFRATLLVFASLSPLMVAGAIEGGCSSSGGGAGGAGGGVHTTTGTGTNIGTGTGGSIGSGTGMASGTGAVTGASSGGGTSLGASTGTSSGTGTGTSVGTTSTTQPVDAGKGSDGSTTTFVDAGPVVSGDFTVLLGQPRGAVTGMMYGHNWLSATQFAWKAIGRFGGDPTSVHNYKDDTYNAGSDYYFENVVMTAGGYQTWETFVQEGTKAQAPILLVVPTIGWVAETAGVCSYPKATFPTQTGYDSATNCGNGKVGNGYVPTQIPLDAGGLYVPSAPSDVVSWLTQIQTTYGAGVWNNLIIGLDNEPDWWNTTHYDVHPTAVAIADAWTNNLAYASAIKAAFPGIKIIGPDWVAYWDTTSLQTYLENIASYRTSKGVQLIDYLDIHFYPGYGSLSFGCTGMPDATRLQTPRLFWDSTYPDPTDNMFGGPIYLIPRYKALIAQTNAQVKLAITEYNFGYDSCAAGAVVQAELLAVFGRYGLDMATRWGSDPNATPANYDGLLPAGSAAESAFRLFLEHNVVGTSVVVDSAVAGTLDPDAGVHTSANGGGFGIDKVTAYGVLNGNTINVLLFNKQTTPATVKVQLGSAAITSAQGWGFSVANTAIAAIAAPMVNAGLATITLPAESATLVAATVPSN